MKTLKKFVALMSIMLMSLTSCGTKATLWENIENTDTEGENFKFVRYDEEEEPVDTNFSNMIRVIVHLEKGKVSSLYKKEWKSYDSVETWSYDSEETWYYSPESTEVVNNNECTSIKYTRTTTVILDGTKPIKKEISFYETPYYSKAPDNADNSTDILNATIKNEFTKLFANTLPAAETDLTSDPAESSTLFKYNYADGTGTTTISHVGSFTGFKASLSNLFVKSNTLTKTDGTVINRSYNYASEFGAVLGSGMEYPVPELDVTIA